MNQVIESQATRSAIKVQQNIFLDQDVNVKSCRICLETELDNDKLIITPCKCKGSMGQVHEQCLKTWIVTYNKQIFTQCEICKFDYQIEFTSQRVCIARKTCKTNIENLVALGCLLFICSGFAVLQIFLIMQIVNIYDGNDSNNSSSDFMNSPITMIGFCLLVFVFLLPIFYCLLYIIKKMLFVTKIKSWKILERPPTPVVSSQEMEHNTHKNGNHMQKKASQLLLQVPKINQTTSILVNQGGNDYEHIQFI